MGDIDADTMSTFIKFLRETSPRDAKISALDFLLGLTGSNEGLEIVYQHAELIFGALVNIIFDSDPEIADKAGNIILNISAENRGTELLLSVKFRSSKIRFLDRTREDDDVTIFHLLMDELLNSNSMINRKICAIFSNLSRNPVSAQQLLDCHSNPREILIPIVSKLLQLNSNDFDYLTSFLSNLCQSEEICRIFLEPSNSYLEELLILMDCNQSALRRKSVVRLVRNLCISTANHEKLLDLLDLGRLLLPLAGPEEFDDEDNEKLPLDLQYLPDDKSRESDPDIRLMLVEILTQLCSTRHGRDILRESNIYVILREYHKWETNEEILQALENLVNFLIRTEEEIGVDNLKEMSISDS